MLDSPSHKLGILALPFLQPGNLTGRGGLRGDRGAHRATAAGGYNVVGPSSQIVEGIAEEPATHSAWSNVRARPWRRQLLDILPNGRIRPRPDIAYQGGHPLAASENHLLVPWDTSGFGQEKVIQEQDAVFFEGFPLTFP